MAQLKIYQNPDYAYWPDMVVGGTEISHSGTFYKYTSDAGLTVSLNGTGFVYDAAGLGVGGIVTSVVIRDSTGTKVFDITGVSADLDAVTRFIFGFPREDRTPQDPDGERLFEYLLRGDDTLIGSDSGDDILGNGSGGFGNDLIQAGGGDDYVKADYGRDTIDGGDGYDELSYFDQPNDPLAYRGVDVNVATGVAIDMWGFVDTISGFERFRDSAFSDLFVGSLGDESFRLSRGADTVDGGDGYDFVRYDRAGRVGAVQGIVVDLALGTIIDPWGLTDRVSHVEGVIGTNRADTFRGDGANNTFQGLKGVDRFEGRQGYDRVEFWAVSDLGGHGVVIDAALTTGQIRDDGFGNIETVTSIEAWSLSGLGDSYNGGTGKDDVWGDSGNDTIRGNAGEDFLSGGDGNDAIYGGKGPNHLSGNAGIDSLYGGTSADDFNFHELGAQNRDFINGFNSAQLDEIWLDSQWGGLSAEFLTSGQFRSGAGVTTANTAAQRVLYDTATGELRFDVDGVGGNDAVIFAVVVNKAALTFADFHVFL